MSPRLLLDLGNTRLKWALAECVDGDWRLGEVQALAHGGPDFLPTLAHALRALPELASVHLVSVADPALTEALCRCVEESARRRQPLIQRARTEARSGPLVCAYPQPAHLGTDRWLSLRGALGVSAPPLLVVGAGTALTLDAIDADCRHRGGLILAGIQAMRDGLLSRAPHLQTDSGAPSATEFWATDTAPAVAMAPWQAAAGLIERACRRFERELGRAPKLLLAGGDAEALAELIDWPLRIEPRLVLLGLLQQALDADAPSRDR